MGTEKPQHYIQLTRLLVSSIPSSYGLVFFTSHKWFTAIIMAITFIDYHAGFLGLLSVLTANIISYSLGFDRQKISAGFYGFNALLTGLGMGYYFEISYVLIGLVMLAAISTVLLSIALEGILFKYRLPFLSLPFLVVYWIFWIAAFDFTMLGLNSRGIFMPNELFGLGGRQLVDFYNWANIYPVANWLKTYFIAMGAVFFQYNIFAGILLSAGLLLWSRIAWMLSLIGFLGADLFYHLTGAPMTDQVYAYIGFNFILTAIALGGYFMVPSPRSFGWTILIIPLVAVFTLFFSKILSLFHLPVYSLPFNAIVILFVFVIKLRPVNTHSLTEVIVHHETPEINLYLYHNHLKRFSTWNHFPVYLPFSGIWQVAQGHDGKHTHKGSWKHAWDFVMQGPDGKNYRSHGQTPGDFYCYDKPVLSPADGIVEEIADGIDDNPSGQVNLAQNWGNTIIIKHAEGLYTKLSHLKKNSFSVKKGDWVKRGQMIARCGNSGRSPEPHLHFQLQQTPYIGSETLDYPIAGYISSLNQQSFHCFDRPGTGDNVCNVERNTLLVNAFHFIPGQVITFKMQISGKEERFEIEIKTNEWNQPYMLCRKSGAKAFFNSNHSEFYFTHYSGKPGTMLYYFYLSCYRILLGSYPEIIIRDVLPPHQFFSGFLLLLHDFTAPFFRWLTPEYESRISHYQKAGQENNIVIESTIIPKVPFYKMDSIRSAIRIGENGIKEIEIVHKNQIIKALCEF